MRLLILLCLLAGTALLVPVGGQARGLWPPLVALAGIVLTRRAVVGLLAGGYAGAVLLAGGDPWAAYLALFAEHLAPSLASPWQTGALAFTLLLGGFAAVLEASGGFAALLARLAPAGRDAARRLQLAAVGLGLVCFFDGLANSLLVGRVGRPLADRCGVARVKLAYLVDSTSSAVACVALVSTWIAFQLGMIAEAFASVGREVSPYAVFLRSLPYNFHCWLTLVLLVAAVWWDFLPGPMRRFEVAARQAAVARAGAGRRDDPGDPVAASPRAGAARALIPLAVLLLAFLGGFVLLGAPEPRWPLTRAAVVAAFGSDAGPLVMVLASLVATAVAMALLPGRPVRRLAAGGRAFAAGSGAMLAPVGVLVAAWILGSVVEALGTAELLAGLARRAGVVALVPLLTFLTGALVSFATGTSWGTMGLLFPLTVPAAAAAAGDLELARPAPLLHAVVAAVFSGAVFGDHCSPFSDTTIVTSIACGIEPHDHVRTQLPYALITAAVAALLGFLPAGLGVPAGVSLAAGAATLAAIAWRGGERRRRGGRLAPRVTPPAGR
jgi:Na+/H+ antiporter NhaC